MARTTNARAEQADIPPAGKKPWTTPRVIEGEIAQTETGIGPASDISTSAAS